MHAEVRLEIGARAASGRGPSLGVLYIGALLWGAAAEAQAPPRVEEPSVHPEVTPAAPAEAGSEPSAADGPGDLAPDFGPPAPASPAPTPPDGPPADQGSKIPPGSAPPGPVPPAFPPAIPNIDFGARLRIGGHIQDPENAAGLGDLGMTVDADFYFNGQLHEYLKWMVSFTLGSYGGGAGAPSSTSPQLLDATVQFEPMPELRLYAGRMLVTVDRYSQSGPWTIDNWFYPGFLTGGPFPSPPAVPQAGVPAGREVGVNLWGTPLGGHIKYYLGVYRLQDPTLSPLLSGRVQVSLLSPEPYWFHRTHLYGDQDLISFGIGGQYQANGSVGPTPMTDDGMPGVAPVGDYSGANADLVVEKRLGALGGVSFDAAGYLFDGDFNPFSSLVMVGAGFTFAKVIGIGRFRPSLRLQRAQRRSPQGLPDLDGSLIFDAQLTYVIMNWYARVVLGLRHISDHRLSGGVVESGEGNLIYLGVTLWDP